MANRLSKIYTRTGDSGSTGLGDGSRVAKDSKRIEAIGSVDELNSALGVLLALGGEISVPIVAFGVLPSFVYRTDEPAVASDITTGFVPLLLAM